MPLTVTIRVPASKAALDAMLEGLVGVNVAYLERNPNTPRLYDAGVRYQQEPPGREEWLTIPQLYARRVGDCEDLGGALAAEYRVDGWDAWACAKRTGKKRFHTLVCIREDGEVTVEDPSRVLGMRKKRWRKSKSR